MASLLSPPQPIFTPSSITKLTSYPKRLNFFIFNYPFHHKTIKKLVLARPFFPLNAAYTQGLHAPSSPSKTYKIELENDPITVLNTRIRREYGKKDVKRPVMDSEEADKYIQMVKEQQQRGLQKLKGDRESKDGTISYKVDPYTLSSGDYVVHKKVGIGKFVAIKLDIPENSNEPIEYVYIEYADGMAKLPVKQASKMLYRYSL
jgi:transcription-repair coupling factor (superfamily II helicase)